MELGVSPNDIFNRMEGGNTYESQLFLARLLLRSKPLMDGVVMLTYEEPQDLVDYGIQNRPSDTLYASLLGVDDVEVVLYFKIAGENLWEIGMRSAHSSSVDVGAICAEFGGGGHRKAAGATVEGSFDDLLSRLVTIIKKQRNL